MQDKKIVKSVKSVIKFIFEFLEPVVFSFSIFAVIYIFIAQPFEVKGASMEPQFHDKEYILTEKVSTRFGSFKRGDIVIFRFPYNREIDYIKRIIGLPGETISVLDGKVYVNDKVLNEPYLRDITDIYPDPDNVLQEGKSITVPQNYYFVLGDNRPHSQDSRYFGPVARSLLIGKAVIRYWPITNISLVDHPDYGLGF